MNMVDNITGPMGRISSSVNGGVSRLQKLESAFGGMVKAGTVMTELGSSIAGAALAPVEATFETRRALGELASLEHPRRISFPPPTTSRAASPL